MPIHDWTRVSAGTWHDFHLAWIAEIRNTLNDGRMPPDYYAQAEQIAGPLGPDVLTLQTDDEPESPDEPANDSRTGGLTVAVAPPRPKLIAETEMNNYRAKRRTIIIRHSSDDRIVALVELVSPGNKGSQHAFRNFVEKAIEAMSRGYHLLIVDLFPPTPRDPNGLHAAIWNEFCGEDFTLPAETPLALIAYSCGPCKRAYQEPTAVGRTLIEMPLFLQPDIYINVPLEETYTAAYRGVPRKWKAVLEA